MISIASCMVLISASFIIGAEVKAVLAIPNSPMINDSKQLSKILANYYQNIKQNIAKIICKIRKILGKSKQNVSKILAKV